MATAAARLLFLSGFPVLVLERAQPLAVRRLVSFAEAVVAGRVEVEGVPARRVEAAGLAAHAFDAEVAVAVDPEGACLAGWQPRVLVDGRMAKGGLDADSLRRAALLVGLGPGFVAGKDVDAVVETQRGPELGRVLWSGSAEPDTMTPSPVLGYSEERVVRSPGAGWFRARASIGDLVAPHDLLGEVGGTPVSAPIGGLVRGLLADGVPVTAGTKLGDIDPRGSAVNAAAVSEKARAVAAGVLEAVLLHLRREG